MAPRKALPMTGKKVPRPGPLVSAARDLLLVDCLARLADALGVSTGALAGAGLDMPPGQQRPAGRPVPQPLSAAQCRGYLDTRGVGRLVFAGPHGLEAIPVNYAMRDDDIIVRTGAHTSLASRTGQSRVSFEVDHLDEALAEGWSVLASGRAQAVATPAELETVRSLGIEPWAGGNRDTYIRIAISDITGRRIRASA